MRDKIPQVFIKKSISFPKRHIDWLTNLINLNKKIIAVYKTFLFLLFFKVKTFVAHNMNKLIKDYTTSYN